MTRWNYPINFVIAAFIAFAIDSHLEAITVQLHLKRSVREDNVQLQFAVRERPLHFTSVNVCIPLPNNAAR